MKQKDGYMDTFCKSYRSLRNGGVEVNCSADSIDRTKSALQNRGDR